MQPVDYEQVAASYDRRYEANDFAPLERTLVDFVGTARSIAELGCGTGHWLKLIAALPHRPTVFGLDLAWAMLLRAANGQLRAGLVQGNADNLPWRDGALERVFAVNALHHFPNAFDVFVECARVIAPGGAFLTIGLDPHTGIDRWWVYDFFPSALLADRQRYQSTDALRAALAVAGFRHIETVVAQHLPARMPFDEAAAKGFLDRRSTSQLLIIGDVEWAAGSERLRRERPILAADLRLYATVGWR